MKKSLLLTVILVVAFMGAKGQKLIIGERAPELKTKEWLTSEPSGNKAKLIDFFHSSCTQVESHLKEMNDYATRFSSQLDVIIVVRESADKAEPLLKISNRKYYVVLDDTGKSFSNYTVQYIPFSVLVDAKGRVRWFGNSNSLQDKIITDNIR